MSAGENAASEGRERRLGRVCNGMGLAYGGDKEWWLARVSVRAGLSLRQEYVFLTLFMG